jgi:D-tyrosyl-tRNA(Tyr) deacylase
MRLVVQRVTRGRVEVGGAPVGAIGQGLLVLAGAERGDGPAQVARAAEKLVHLRVFGDATGKMNLDVQQARGAILLVSQFTLLASTERGRRPSFERAAPPAVAATLVDQLAAHLRAAGLAVEQGRFGAHMEVELVNDGPVTLVLDFPPEA